MLKQSEGILVAAQQTAMRSKVARLLVAQGYRVEIASSEKTARQVLGKGHLAAAIVAPAGLGPRELDMLRDVQDVVRKLVIVADDARHVSGLAASFPQAQVQISETLDNDRLLAFLANLHKPPASIVETPPASEHLNFAGCTLDVTGRTFLNTGAREVPLTRGEFALLVVFTRNCGKVLSRNQLRNMMDGGSTDSYDRSIDMLVARLRRKIEPNPANPEFILTVPGVGYKFTPHVHRDEMTTPHVTPRDFEEVVLAAGEVPRVERRQITVLSVQILGFAALAAKLDPEDLDGAIGPVCAVCAEVIARFGGTMMHTLGDCVLAYFGYPKAQENDAPRAVRAALELLGAIRAIEAPSIGNFRARIGIATGLMLVGELRSMAARDTGGMGEALNLALHLQKAAPADSVVIAATTRSLIGRFFECRQVEPVELETGAEPVPAWHVINEVGGIPRFDALRREDMLGLVGREAEMERLRQCWSKTLGGQGQVVLLTGEAGIGKSRLTVEFQERLCDEAHDVVRFSGAPQRADAPMSALLDELQVSAAFAGDDGAAQKVEKLQNEFAALGAGAAEAAALVCTLLGLPFDTSPQVHQMSPQRRKERIFAGLLTRIEALAARRAVFVLVEDAHWIDPTSMEFIAVLVERSSAMRMLLLIVARPEFVAPWPEYSHLTTLALSRLSHANSALLIQQVAGDRRIANDVEADITARADGVPLFVEELTRSVLEIGERAALSAGSAAKAPIPSTLHGLLLARFDRLDRGKAVAQAGAVIGREFSFELLRCVVDLDEPVLFAALDQVVGSGLVFRRGAAPQARYVFKHALVRDAAYSTLLREARRKLHARVARSLEAKFPEIVIPQPELLAYHWREAGNAANAISYLITASERALARSATTEAMGHLAQAGDLAAGLPENRDRWQLELKLEITRGRALIAQRGYAASETRQAYLRARTLCNQIDDQYHLPLVLLGHSVNTWFTADYSAAMESAQELLRWGTRENVSGGIATAHFLIGMTLPMIGEFASALPHLESAIEIDQFALPGRPPFLASEADGRFNSLMYLHTCLFLLGRPEQASAAADRALAKLPAHRYSLAAAQINACRMHALERDYENVSRIAVQVRELAEEQGYPFFTGTSLLYLGWSLAHTGDPAEGVALCAEGIAKLRGLGAINWFTRYLAYMAQCHEKAGELVKALDVLDDAFAIMQETGETAWGAELYRLKGNLLAQQGRLENAEDCFCHALATARGQQARLLELRAATDLACLLSRHQERAKAYKILAPIYASFTEGYDCVDLKDAKALLDRVASGQLPAMETTTN